ncbi:hypothetical protein P171DRAFT_487934 [Karstenula rhodostoma CBS 690.94]|uniref:BTB domain-containing protein n=1 Tax=Karstenula rhodostoma CBS 690.94 TaxID=1392251 RepID=A0A9P4U9Q4_9PLEO|nr:hypothetical protein P171DRAFT_487934 [Karstenula rhodostoma CBS 690.94]
MTENETKTEASNAPAVEDNHVFRGTTVLVKVGPDAKEYHIHEAPLLRHSEFFRGALGNTVFSSAQDKIVKLDDIEPSIFDIFAYWLYHERLPSADYSGDDDWDKAFPKPFTELPDMWNEQRTAIIHAYVLADRILAAGFKRECFEEAHNMFRFQGPAYAAITYAWDNLPETSAMLELLVESHCYSVTNRQVQREHNMGESQEAIDELPNNFLYRVTRKYEDAIINKEISAWRALESYDDSNAWESKEGNM